MVCNQRAISTNRICPPGCSSGRNGVALYTTLSALVGGVLIAVQYYNLESGCEELFSVLNQISEISIDNSL